MSQIELPGLPADADVEATKAYVRRLVRTIGPGWHPEDRQDSYVDFETGMPSFNSEQCALLSSDVARASALLAAAGTDICDVALPAQRKLLWRQLARRRRAASR